MPELEATWRRVISVWWLLFWRGMLGSILLGAVAGFIVGFGAGILKIPFDPIYTGVLGAIIGLAWILVVVRMALRKHYQDFRIVLAPRVP
ncbi:MAG: hypothetical protein K2Z80_23595 [Xanthobacteraceae bacterium]|nr:hypothetical protein [Xanthobacteraceae bacterium]